MIVAGLLCLSINAQFAKWGEPHTVQWKQLTVRARVLRNAPNKSDEIVVTIANKSAKTSKDHRIADDYSRIGLYLYSGKFCDMFFYSDRYVGWMRVTESGDLLKMTFPWNTDKRIPDTSRAPYICGKSADSLLIGIDYERRGALGTWRYYQYDSRTAHWTIYEGVEPP